MSDRVQGKVALITGAARGQGRAHAVRLAEEGADIIALDACRRVADTTAYPPSTPEDLAETVALVEKLGRRIIAEQVDVRDYEALESLTRRGSEELGGLHVVVANAGIADAWAQFWEITPGQWQTMIDINLTGVWHTIKAAAPLMIEQGQGGSMILISSVAGLKPLPAQAHYVAAKTALVGLCSAAALELGPHDIRINSLHPYAVDTPMGEPTAVEALLARHPSFGASFGQVLQSPSIAQPKDIADAVLYLASDESRTMTGAHLPLDLGATKV